MFLIFPDARFVKTTPMFEHRLLKGFEACAVQLIRHHLPAVAHRLLTTYNTDWHIAKSECWTLSPCFSIAIINTEANLMSKLLVTTSNETQSVCYFLLLIRNKTDLLKLKSLFANVLDVWLSLLLRLRVCSQVFSVPANACLKPFRRI